MIVQPKNFQPALVQPTIVHTENRPSITARALLLLLRVYQTYLSPMNFSACRFYPSCSHYAGEAVQRFGARRGIWLTLKRLARCQPFSKGGFDPVPDAPISSRTPTEITNEETLMDASYQHNPRHRANGSCRGTHAHNVDGSYQGTALAVPYRRSDSGVLTPDASSHSSDTRATRGQEFAQ